MTPPKFYAGTIFPLCLFTDRPEWGSDGNICPHVKGKYRYRPFKKLAQAFYPDANLLT